MQAPEEHVTKEKVAQDATIPKVVVEEEKVQIEGSFTWLGKKWETICTNEVCKYLFCTSFISP